LAAHTVLVRDGRIAAVAPGAALAVPPDATVIDGRGKFLLPGLCDMHVHISNGADISSGEILGDAETLARYREYVAVFLRYGVTTVRNMAGTPMHLALRAEIASGATRGPRIFSSGPILETRFTWPGLKAVGKLVTSVEDARAIVRAHHREGYDFVKVYNDIDADIYDMLVQTSREVGLPIIGHVAFAKGLDGALAARQDSIEHLRAYDFAADARTPPGKARFEGWLHSTPQRLAELAERTAAAGVWNVPTLVVQEHLPPGETLPPRDFSGLPGWLTATLERLYARQASGIFSDAQLQALHDGTPHRMAMVAALDSANAPMMAGSDGPLGGLIPGDCLLKELELFAASGVSPLRTLEYATIRPAEFLGIQTDAGTVEEGKLADLLLLDADPLISISAIRRQSGVMVAGEYMPH
jgi:imidazolonepropionase-like amidohydrolase